jgi:AraC-like DNA-binding protein
MENEQPLTPDEQQKAEKVKNFLIANIEHIYTLKELSKACNVPQNFIKKRFRAAFKKTQHQYIFDYRMELVLTLLRQNRSLKFISLSVGYSKQAAFSKAFKKKYKCTPTEYIAKYINKRNI